MRWGCGWRRCRPRPWRCGSSLPRLFQLLPARRAEPTRGGSAAGAALPRALEASDDLAVLGDLRELLDPAADVSDIQAVTLTGHDAFDVHDVLRTARHALVDDEILGRAKSHAAALSHVVGDGAGNRLFLEAGQGQAQIGRARARHVDRQDAVLEGEGDGVLQTRRKRRGNFTEASLFSAGGQQDREIDIDRQTRLAPALDGDAVDDHVGDVALGEETMQLPGRFELAVHRLPASRRRSATRCSMARRSSAAPRSRGRACHVSTRRSYWARASATLRVRSSRSLRSRRMAWPRRSRCRWSWTSRRGECMASAFYRRRSGYSESSTRAACGRSGSLNSATPHTGDIAKPSEVNGQPRRWKMFRGRSLAAVVVVSAAILGVGCRTGQTPEVRMLSEKEAADFWNRAESREPAGQPSVRKIENGTGTVVITTQAYTLRMPGGGGGGLVTGCGGGCQAG